MIDFRFRQVLRLVAVLALGLNTTSAPRAVVTAARAGAGQDAFVNVRSEVYPPSIKAALDNREPPVLKRVYTRDSIPNRVTLTSDSALPPPPASDRAKQRLQVGYSRDIPASGATSLRRAARNWAAVDGGSVTAVSVASPGAVALRLAVAFESLPAGTEVRFFGPGADSQVFGPVTPEQIRAQTVPAEPGEPGVYWSPVVSGDTAGMEIFVPTGLERDVSFMIPRVSHHYRSVESTQQAAESTEQAAGSCEIDLACYSASWGTSAQAVAKIDFLSGSADYLCTGTLLNDTDSSTFIPYFMTANHCVSTQAEASTIFSYWNYQRTTCGGVLGSYTTLFGGATLLSHGDSSDHSFLRLNDPAPSAAYFEGWSASTVSPGTSMVGIHHPGGDVKKISFGVIDGIADYLGPVTGSGGFLRVHFTAGVTEPGSSGSALITGSYPNDQFVGTLEGGYDSCSLPTEGVWYGRFDLVYPLIKAYLSPVVPPTVATGLASGIGVNSATLNGTANPNGTTATGWFEYGFTTSYDHTTPVQTLGSGNGGVFIGGGGISGLLCNTSYHFRARATGPSGSTAGLDATFTTAACPLPPSVVTGVANGILTRGATLNGTANPNGLSTTASFQYGLTTSYGNTTLPVNLGAGSTPVAIGNGAIVGLACNTLYHFRAVTTNAVGTTTGSDATFATLRCTTSNGDFDGDGKADLGLYRRSTGYWYIKQSNTNYATYLAYQWGLSTDMAVPGDYDGDGQGDLGLYRPSTGYWYVLLSNATYTTYLALPWGISGDIPVPGDYDGDGKTDLGLYRPSTGYWYILLSSTNYTTYIAKQWGLSTDVAVAGDYDGDGKTDIGLYRPSTGYWYVLLSSTNYTTYLAQPWGLSTDVSVAGDYDGDGKADLGLYRPSTGYWYVLLSSSNYTTYLAQPWGLSADLPVAADYDGDGKTDLGLYRPGAGYWYILLSSTNYATYIAQAWGLNGDTPVLRR